MVIIIVVELFFKKNLLNPIKSVYNLSFFFTVWGENATTIMIPLEFLVGV